MKTSLSRGGQFKLSAFVTWEQDCDLLKPVWMKIPMAIYTGLKAITLTSKMKTLTMILLAMSKVHVEWEMGVQLRWQPHRMLPTQINVRYRGLRKARIAVFSLV